MLYDSLREPPKPGSLLEILCIMVQMRRELARFHETAVVVQAMRDSDDGEATQRSFERFRDSVMPYLKKELESEQAKVIKALRAETERGPLKVVPIATVSRARSALRNQISKIKRGSIRW